MKLNYYKNLDGVRAIAALLVMFLHFFQYNNIQNDSVFNVFKKIAIFGQTGVDLFFVLSGFLITRILIQTKSDNNYFKNFIFRRILRIFPLYYFFLLIYYFIAPFLLDSNFIPFNEQWYYYSYLQNFATTFGWNANGPEHFWSLAVEEHFYLFWPLIIYLFSTKNIKYIIFGLVVFSVLLRVFMIQQNYGVFYFTFTRIDGLAIGAALALLEIKSFFKKKNKLIFLVLALFLILSLGFLWIKYSGKGMLEIYKYLLVALFYFCMISYVLSVKSNSLINKILESKPFNFSGKISYGLYVYHPIIFMVIFKRYKTEYWILQLLLSFVITYIIAFLSFYFFENQFLKLKKYF